MKYRAKYIGLTKDGNQITGNKVVSMPQNRLHVGIFQELQEQLLSEIPELISIRVTSYSFNLPSKINYHGEYTFS